MAVSDTQFAGSIPEFYDRLMVPLIFRVYADDLAARLARLAPSHILEIAAGTGVLTRAMAKQLPADARIVASDLNQPMLDHARAQQAGDKRITWEQADAQALRFSDHAFDAVACQFGAMFFPDKVGAYREARRVLKPGGRFLFNVWDRIADNEFADVVTEAMAGLFPDDPPRFLARTPHGYHDPDVIRAQLTAAGFTGIAIDSVERRSIARSPDEPAIAYCQGTVLRNEIEARKTVSLSDATKVASEALARRFGTGRIDGRISALVISASADAS